MTKPGCAPAGGACETACEVTSRPASSSARRSSRVATVGLHLAGAQGRRGPEHLPVLRHGADAATGIRNSSSARYTRLVLTYLECALGHAVAHFGRAQSRASREESDDG